MMRSKVRFKSNRIGSLPPMIKDNMLFVMRIRLNVKMSQNKHA